MPIFQVEQGEKAGVSGPALSSLESLDLVFERARPSEISSVVCT